MSGYGALKPVAQPNPRSTRLTRPTTASSQLNSTGVDCAHQPKAGNW